ncbi:MAG TPA: S-adenosylmethionine:tRNA ribosyltransferase-isomerase, partial [Candidatus Dormibacteraeota bacterium]|nr:S-adenosylmethionine:tRNA ribosyltransferase-isomerase [Candidatus Dormibacteraeota bacterium]
MSRTQPAPLPPELRASLPAEMRGLRRDHVRLLVAGGSAGSVVHTRFDHLPDFLGKGDVVVLNTSRTLAAGVPARRADGTSLQLRPCVRREDSWDVLAVAPEAPHRNLVLQPGERLRIGGALEATVVGRRA